MILDSKVMKKSLYFIVPFFVMGSMISSCVDDKGSYDLSPINEVEISNIDEEDGYTVFLSGGELIIEPEVKGTMAEVNDPDRYTYRWYISILENMTSGATRVIELGNERVLHYKPENISPGTYTLYFEVADKNTGLKFLKETSVLIQSKTMSGFLVLGEKSDGSVKMDMIATIYKQDTILIEDVFVDPNIKKPENLLFIGASRYGSNQNMWLTAADEVYSMTSGSNINILETNTFDKKLLTTFDIKRPAKILDMYPRPVGSSSRGNSYRGYITEDAIFEASLMGGEQLFGNPINRYDGLSTELFKPYPLAFTKNGYMSSFSLNVMFYDMDRQAFVVPNSSSASSVAYCKELKDNSGDVFNWNQGNTTRELVFAQNGNNSNSYALFKDAENNWNVFVFSVTSVVAPKKVGAYAIDLSVATNFDKADIYAFSSDETEILYTVGSQLWGYDYARNKAVMLKDYNNEIIYLVQDVNSTTSKCDFIIATSNGDYKSQLSKFYLIPNPDDIAIEEDENLMWNINSRIKAIEWKNAADLEDESGYY